VADDLSTTAAVRLAVKGLLGFKSDTREAADAINQLKRANQAAASSSNEAASGVFNLQRGLRWLATGTFVAGVWAAVGAIKSMAVNVVQTGLGFNSMKEQAILTFTTLTRSATTARKLFADLMTLALHSPFDPTNVQQGAQMLLTFGFNARQIVPIMTQLANVAAANPLFGPTAVEHLALVLGQIRSSGRLMGQDALQLAQFGVNAYAVVATAMGKTEAQVRAMGKKGALDSKAVIDDLMAYFARRYDGLAGKLSMTYGGIVSNLKQAYETAAGALLAPAMPSIERHLNNLQNYLGSPAFAQRIRGFQLAMVSLWHAIGPLVIGIGELGFAITKALVLPILALLKFLAPVLVPALRGLGFALQWVSKQGWLVQIISLLLFGWITKLAEAGVLAGLAMTRFGGYIVDVVLALNRFFGAGTKVGGVLAFIFRYLGWIKNLARIDLVITLTMVGWHQFTRLGDWVQAHVGQGNNANFHAVLRGQAPHQAQGGHTIGAGWSWVGENGPELMHMDKGATVVPLDRVGGGERVTHIHVDLDGETIAQAVYRDAEHRMLRK
jgi:tape measure domain-containing protein